MFADTLLCRRTARVEQPFLEWRERSVDWDDVGQFTDATSQESTKLTNPLTPLSKRIPPSSSDCELLSLLLRSVHSYKRFEHSACTSTYLRSYLHATKGCAS